MIRAWLTDQGFALGPAVALILFFGVFLGVLAWVYRPGSKHLYEQEARLPLHDDASPGRDRLAGGNAPRDTDSKEG